jgi:membrane protein implicated in regulation of membrane protease activity
MAKSSSKTHAGMPTSRRVTLDPFNGVLGVFFLVFTLALPIAMPASDGRLNVLHFIGMAVFGLLSAFFFWRWLRAQLAHALRNELDEEVARIRATTFAQDAEAKQAPPQA